MYIVCVSIQLSYMYYKHLDVELLCSLLVILLFDHHDPTTVYYMYMWRCDNYTQVIWN